MTTQCQLEESLVEHLKNTHTHTHTLSCLQVVSGVMRQYVRVSELYRSEVDINWLSSLSLPSFSRFTCLSYHSQSLWVRSPSVISLSLPSSCCFILSIALPFLSPPVSFFPLSLLSFSLSPYWSLFLSPSPFLFNHSLYPPCCPAVWFGLK